MPKRTWLLAALLAMLLMFAGSAQAHKVKLFASAEGKTIRGYVYFPGGARAAHVKVWVMGPGGKKLGETTADEKGEFAFQASYKCDHLLIADVGEGHRAQYTVRADELPDNLPILGDQAEQSLKSKSADAAVSGKALSDMGKGPINEQGFSESRLTAVIEKAVSRQVRPLREQIERYEEKVRLHDILGGIGYIMGIMGLIFFWKGRAQSKGR